MTDQATILLRLAEAGDAEAGIEIAVAELGVQLEGKGELLWDAAEGHVHSLALDAKLELGLRVDLTASAEGEEVEVHCEAEFLGDSRWTMTKP